MVKDTVTLWDLFTEFEVKYELFNIQDENGSYIWDIVRSQIYLSLLWDYQPIQKYKEHKSIFLIYKKIRFIFFYYLNVRKYKYFFFLTSRNIKEGKRFDQNAEDSLTLLPKNEVFIFESYLDFKIQPLHASHANVYHQLLFRLYNGKKNKFDFQYIINSVITVFGRCPLSSIELNSILNDYYSDFFFFKKLFKRKKIEKVFITQNGVQKGLFAAANALNIPTFEFQHGIIDKGHLIYNYPQGIPLKGKSFLPATILTLSKFWLQDLYLPQVKCVPVGNSYFSKAVGSIKSEDINNILVISADVFGRILVDALFKGFNEQPGLMKYSYFFKLHPNQFHEVEFYKDLFKDYKNVQIFTNEKSVNELLTICNTIFTIQSTAVYEALQAQRRVILLIESSYKRHAHIFNHPNVKLILSASELINVIELPISNIKTEFFSDFNQSLFKKEILCLK